CVTQVAVFQIGPCEVGPFEIASGEGRVAPEVRDGLPEHCMEVWQVIDVCQVIDGSLADDLAEVVHREGVAVGAAEGAEIDHSARRRPRERVERGATGSATTADDLSITIHREGLTESAAEGAEIDHPARRRPRERVLRTVR